MATKPKQSSHKKGAQKRATIRNKVSPKRTSPSRKRAGFAVNLDDRSGPRGETAVTIVPDTPIKYRLYGSKSSTHRPQVASKSSATRIVDRLGITPRVVREVDSVIANLRLRKKIG
jgi:hypothetical protein